MGLEMLQGKRQRVGAEPVQVDLDQVGIRAADFALLAQVLLPVRPGRFVARAEEFDDGDDSIAAFAVDDLDKGLGGAIGLGLYQERLRDGSARCGPRYQASLRR